MKSNAEFETPRVGECPIVVALPEAQSISLPITGRERHEKQVYGVYGHEACGLEWLPYVAKSNLERVSGGDVMKTQFEVG